MAKVDIKPMPQGYRKISAKYRPQYPPIFPDGTPTDDDIVLARELFAALDEESQEWYRRGGRSRLFEGI